MSSALNTSLTFDIPADELKVKCGSPRPRIACGNSPKIASDERLSVASSRRAERLNEIAEKNKIAVDEAKQRSVLKKKEFNAKINEIAESTELDLVVKTQRRDQILQERVNNAKKCIEKVQYKAEVFNASLDGLRRQIDEDMSTKENNRRSWLHGIRAQCKERIDKANEVRMRAASFNGSDQ